MKLNAPAFGTAPPICAKTIAGHCNDKKKKKNSKALELNRIKCKKKKIYGAAWHLITKKTEKMFVYMRR